MRKTFAILGNTGALLSEVLQVLMKQDFRLLLVSENEEKKLALKKSLEQTEAVAEVEFTSCKRDGCWEADIIIITQLEKASCSLLETIKEVATQKIVLLISEHEKQLRKPNFEQLLPHSKVVKVLLDLQNNRFSLFSKHYEAKTEVQERLLGAGFQRQL
ncbi:hypothetical protein RM545_04205 [Zunongwangia sp. F260]|uniref:Pyrroline-5-carboxylate reductase catalytic N-terminal domain-containing protein n=1 Tax=Autumnicola lenta TaxID=3075593 RepID=A0ABU3CHW7_9FLAO|nr:hypothetical protein [Zunongwangia sp. F260]MDT0645881.1 hypothetical protein [Zunongwangia sp. F260]